MLAGRGKATAMVPVLQFAVVLLLAGAACWLVAALLRRAASGRGRRGTA
jgi:hypothetical protein